MNWGQGIAAFLTLFVIFIGVLIYMTTQSHVDLEAEDYYIQEIEFQDRIDALSKGKEIDQYVKMNIQDSDLVFSLEGIEMADANKGRVEFFRANDSRLDKTFDLDLSSGEQIIPLSEFVKGKYSVKLFFDGKDGGAMIARDLIVD